MPFPQNLANMLIRWLKKGNRLLVGPFAQDLQNGYTIVGETVVGEYTVTLVDATGFVANSLIKLEEEFNGRPTTYYAEVLDNTANVLTLDRPIDRVFTSEALVNRENFLLNVNGSSTPVVFAYKNNFDKKVNLTRMFVIAQLRSTDLVIL